MASNLTFDLAEPAVAKLVAGWVEGEEYDVRCKFIYSSAGPCDITEMVDETVPATSDETTDEVVEEDYTEDEEEEEVPPPAPAAKKSPPKPFGKPPIK